MHGDLEACLSDVSRHRACATYIRAEDQARHPEIQVLTGVVASLHGTGGGALWSTI